MAHQTHDISSRAPQPPPPLGHHPGLEAYLYENFLSLFQDMLNLYITIRLTQYGGDPPEPEAGKGIIWISDGTGKGDAGDVMIAVNQGGTTKYGTLFDHSAGSAW